MSLDNIEIDEQWLKEIAEFPLVEALFGHRSRRFFPGSGNSGRSARLQIRARAAAESDRVRRRIRLGHAAPFQRHARRRGTYRAVYVRHIRQIPGDGAVRVLADVFADASSRFRLLRQVFRAALVFAHPCGASGEAARHQAIKLPKTKAAPLRAHTE